MAEDWGKWQKEWAKHEAKAKKLSLAQGERLMAAVNARDKLIETHEKAFETAVVKAWEKGTKGKTLDEFLKDKGVGDAKKLLDTDRRLLVNELNEVKVYCAECDTVAKPIDKLTDAMGKAIKSTKEKSAERDKAKKLFDEIQAKLRDLHEASHLHYKLDKFLLAFNQQYDKWLSHQVADALKRTKESEDDSLPAPLEEKKLKLMLAEAVKLVTAMEKAMEAAREDCEGDGKKAPALAKTAQKSLEELKKLAMRAKGLREKYKKEIAAAANDDKIMGTIEDVIEHFEGAEKSYKDFMVKLAKVLKGK